LLPSDLYWAGSIGDGPVHGPGQDFFRVQYTEVALALEGGQLRFVFPEYLGTTGSIR